MYIQKLIAKSTEETKQKQRLAGEEEHGEGCHILIET
jgi:hypothetical protein